MMRINLLGDTAAADQARRRQLGIYAASLAAAAALCAGLALSAGRAIDRLTMETAALSAELVELKKTTKEVRELDAKRKELQAKLEVIARLKLSKVGPIRVLDDLNQAVPDRAWLADIGESGGVLKLSGFALDNQTIAAFMKELEKSDFFESVELVETKQSERAGVKIKMFTLETKVNYAGKSAAAAAAAENASSAGRVG